MTQLESDGKSPCVPLNEVGNIPEIPAWKEWGCPKGFKATDIAVSRP